MNIVVALHCDMNASPIPPVLPLVIECEITEADYLALRQHAQKLVYVKMSPLVFVIFVFALLLSWFSDSKATTEERCYGLLGMTILFCIVMGAGFLLLQFFYLRRWNRQNLGPLGKHRFEISLDALTEHTEWGSWELRLPGIKSVDETTDYFLIFSKGGVGFIVPKRALGAFTPLITLRERVKAQQGYEIKTQTRL